MFGVLAIAATTGVSVSLLLALAAFDGTLALAARALTKAAIVAEAEPSGLLAEANRMLNIVFAASMALGPALAGIAVATVGSATALALDGASFAAAGVLLACGGLAAPPQQARVSIRAALSRVRQAGTVPALLVVDGATAVCFALIIPSNSSS